MWCTKSFVPFSLALYIRSSNLARVNLALHPFKIKKQKVLVKYWINIIDYPPPCSKILFNLYCSILCSYLFSLCHLAFNLCCHSSTTTLIPLLFTLYFLSSSHWASFLFSRYRILICFLISLIDCAILFHHRSFQVMLTFTFGFQTSLLDYRDQDCIYKIVICVWCLFDAVTCDIIFLNIIIFLLLFLLVFLLHKVSGLPELLVCETKYLVTFLQAFYLLR